MKYPDMHKKLMFINPHPSWGGGKFSKKSFLLGLNDFPDLQRTLKFGNPQIGKGWGQFIKIFVLDIALICSLDPNSLC